MSLLLPVLVVSSALAAPFGTVDIVTVPDPSGEWVRSSATADAVRIRDGVETSLSAQMQVDVGDTIRTSQARVQIAMEDGEQLNIGEGSEITLRERGALQTLGSIYYQLRDAFKVEYGYVEATVEGTAFLIEPDTRRIGVSDGAVRVSSGTAQTVVEPRQQLSVASEGAVPAASEWSRRDMGRELQNTWPFGRPVFVVSVLGGLGVGQGVDFDPPSPSPLTSFEVLRVSGRFSPLRRIWLTGSAGFRGTLFSAQEGTILAYRTFPFSAGAEVQLGPFAAGGELVLAYHHSFKPGINAVGRVTIPLGRALYLEAQGRLGWVADPYIEAAGGVGFGF